ncbi:MAG: GGDEF domain-containing protein [Sulfurimonas sp.]|uniref:GGDEF domain-containing protein n=1 Tax=Sulfurimonas sp. TaxID=2022749 RepID=UPI00260111E4|nr:GGDEF domain-containing protein [Sulfurimonas sp.]MCK9492296.1 GGDEF domain-containing protein [Sulfurimonas sp.]
MEFIEALKLRSKLLLLFILITLGLVLVGTMGYSNTASVKKNLDTIYFGSLVPVIELNNILQVYHGKISNTIYKVKNSQISRGQASTQIKEAISKIELEWREYEAHFKRDDELQYVEYAAIEIHATNSFFSKMASNILQENIEIENFEARVEYINNIIKKLINYEIELAKYERKRFLTVYDNIILNIGIILGLTILGILIISYYVFKSIQRDHTRLELTTKKLQKANKKLENVSYTDVLTSLHNRRYFNFVYERELKRAKRTKSYITFMMMDIDYFKQYNDTYGHIEGDYALKSVAKVLKDTLKRPSDFVFRLGGEEFGAILTDIDESNSASLAGEICQSIKLREIKHETSKAGEFLTISIGVVCTKADENLDEEILMIRADEMLYKAKENGRDNYVITTNVAKEGA